MKNQDVLEEVRKHRIIRRLETMSRYPGSSKLVVVAQDWLDSEGGEEEDVIRVLACPEPCYLVAMTRCLDGEEFDWFCDITNSLEVARDVVEDWVFAQLYRPASNGARIIDLDVDREVRFRVVRKVEFIP